MVVINCLRLIVVIDCLRLIVVVNSLWLGVGGWEGAVNKTVVTNCKRLGNSCF